MKRLLNDIFAGDGHKIALQKSKDELETANLQLGREVGKRKEAQKALQRSQRDHLRLGMGDQ